MSENTAMMIAAGGITAFMEVCVMHPLDVVKTCLQLQHSPVAGSTPMGVAQYYYTGVVNCVRTVYRQESFLSLWKGVVPPVLIETPRRAMNFLLFENYEQHLLFGAETAKPLTYFTTGLCVGVTEAIVMNPFERVKVTLMADRSPVEKAPSTWDVLKKIVSNKGYGVEGLNRGMSATIISHGIFNMVYFGVFKSLKSRLRPFSDETLYLFHIMGIGFAAGTLASIASNPFDVAKTRIQGPQPEPGVRKYRSPLSTVATIYREERLRALFKGLLPRLLRRGVGSALMVAAYDYTYRYLTNGFSE
ncbi:mitochondrial 2-oxodicarboxylate carrier-like [Schistocerca nitens]|uniref:mitochondrial 2-oxodicarboxylate carrier-like n=1 Tax=Schistocerca nitens TaxID=7011 RepID=UPI00211773D4|nr:mitochondrial 2-oxodicarboxylate carrier-like [Schistocerca nitens]XP_049795736.1 mitochondrial 2-oxodicarboxylate carrier-like [Schistocerca nitens]XP_049795737.1 mitochondrial 2-oxodicarboxylate carrier-like [Schistocerca nitens]XP_049795738.1 mitochondrial 2-oxodicarboxylate carrier-like [Schistocerca nitens]